MHTSLKHTASLRRSLARGAAAVLALCALAQPALGERRHGGPPPPEALIEAHAERLGLADEQLHAISEISRAARSESRELRDALHERRRALRRLLAGDAQEAEAMAAVEAVGAAEIALEKSRVRAMLRIRGLLSATQRETLLEIHEEGRRAHWEVIVRDCGEVLERFCPDAEPGRRSFRCLSRQRESLTPECARHLEGKRRRHGPPTPPLD